MAGMAFGNAWRISSISLLETASCHDVIKVETYEALKKTLNHFGDLKGKRTMLLFICRYVYILAA